ncbi:hypothetical protein JW964_02530 [candidate division KSB1 bacterium]|nr:hypothetical protein [candidate division KSB1 bacterium]
MIIMLTGLLMFTQFIFGQGKPYDGPEDQAGDKTAIREGWMNGNRVLLYVDNCGTLSDMSKPVSSKWPNAYDGLRMIDQVNLLIGAEIYVRHDSIVIQDKFQLGQSPWEVDTLYFLQSNGNMLHKDMNYYETVEWSFYPVPGYVNETQDYVALSNKPDSWPLTGWPSTGYEKKWPGEWNGRFGRGIKYADLETYFVYNDAQDMEYIINQNATESMITDRPRYRPRAGVYIGTHPNGKVYEVSTQKGLPWGGMGIRVAQRGFQWNNPEAKDMIFFEYDISNISDYDILTSGFGYRQDLAVGDEHGPDDDLGYFDKNLDMAYAWDFDGVGVGGYRPGTMGMAFLESPGRGWDNIDNDDDGLIDEKRDNTAGELIGPYDGIADPNKFLKFYNLEESFLHDHYQGDEDQDWRDGIDLNGDGNYAYFDKDKQLWFLDQGEFPGDDVGLDGVGPLDLNYTGPDEGEGNHKPDFIEGIGCEPNFAATDVSESDMIGLTTFRMHDLAPYNAGELHAYNDKGAWRDMTSKIFDSFSFTEPVTLFFTFASSEFPLYKGRTERISMGMLHAYENISDLKSSTHYAPNLYSLKKTAQLIYERDYRFAQPPIMPTLTARAGDGAVYLSWNNTSDQSTREPFLNNINDFEGYKLYRATDKLMTDAEVITDGTGAPFAKKPIFRCDKIDSVFGYAKYGSVNGTLYYLGDETGLQHYYIDRNVQNGRTYYYALVAYDYGHPTIVDGGLSPTENNIVIELDEAEEIVRLGINVQVVTPRANAAGYTEQGIKYESTEGLLGNFFPRFEVYSTEELKRNHKYYLTFDTDTLDNYEPSARNRHPKDIYYMNNGFRVYDSSDSNRLVYQEDVNYYSGDNIRVDTVVVNLGDFVRNFRFFTINEKRVTSDIFDGIQMVLEGLPNKPYPDPINTGWVEGSAPLEIQYGCNGYIYFPWRYEIVFTSSDTAYKGRSDVKETQIDGSGVPIARTNILWNSNFNFYVLEKSFPNSSGQFEKLDLLRTDYDGDGKFDPATDEILVGFTMPLGTRNYRFKGTIFSISFRDCIEKNSWPKAGDIYRVDFKRPFFETDTLRFTVTDMAPVDEKKLDDEMEQIKVVPNPYVASNAMEPAVANRFLNQRRRIMFTHIPADCEIRIFTTSGVLVDKIDVNNEPGNGIVHWDLLSKEDLEIAAGMYFYHVKSLVTGKEKMGKFAVIK